MLPLGIGVLSIALSLGVAAWLSRFFTISILIQTICLDDRPRARHRLRPPDGQPLPRGPRRRGDADGPAAEEAARRAGWTILLSAFPVSIGFAALLTIPLSEQRSVGLAGLLVTLFALLLSVTLLPALLSLLGPRIDALRIRRPNGRRARRAAPRRWRRWGSRVTGRPVLALVLASAPLLLLAAQARGSRTAMPLGDWLPKGSESVRAYHALDTMGRSNLIHSLRVVLDLPPGVKLDSEEGWTAAVRLFEKLRKDPRFERVQCLPAIFDRPDGLRFLPLLSPAVRRTLEASDGSATLFESIPAAAPLAARPGHARPRAAHVERAAITGLPGVRDERRRPARPSTRTTRTSSRGTSTASSLLVVLGTFLALFAGFRSLLVAVKAVLLNLLSVGAAFGALVLVFQEGHGAPLARARPGRPAASFRSSRCSSSASSSASRWTTRSSSWPAWPRRGAADSTSRRRSPRASRARRP